MTPARRHAIFRRLQEANPHPTTELLNDSLKAFASSTAALAWWKAPFSSFSKPWYSVLMAMFGYLETILPMT